MSEEHKATVHHQVCPLCQLAVDAVAERGADAILKVHEHYANVQKENDELEQLFALQLTRLCAATDLWRKAHPDKANVLPDLGDLLAWLIGEIERLSKQPGWKEIHAHMAEVDDKLEAKDQRIAELEAAFAQAYDTAQTRQLKMDMKDQRIKAMAAFIDSIPHDYGQWLTIDGVEHKNCNPDCLRCKWESQSI